MDKNTSKKSFSIESLLSVESPSSSSENKPTTPPLFDISSSWLHPSIVSPIESFHRVPLTDPCYGVLNGGFTQNPSSSFYLPSPGISPEMLMRMSQPNLPMSSAFATGKNADHESE